MQILCNNNYNGYASEIVGPVSRQKAEHIIKGRKKAKPKKQ